MQAAIARKNRNFLWRQGELLWKLHSGQWKIEEAYQSKGKSRLFVLDCARQFGKSTWCVKKALETAIKRPRARIRYGTAFFTDLQEFILPVFEMLLEDCPADVKPRYLSNISTFIFPNGSRIRLVGLDRKPNGLRGNKLTLIILDEAGYMARLSYLYRFVLIPSTTHVKNAKIIMASTQPESPDHEFCEFCDRAAIEGGYVQLTIYDNPLLNQEKIDELAAECGGKESTAFRREYLCERVVEEGRALIPDFRQLCHVVESPKSPAHHFWNRVASLDSGVTHQTAGLFGYYDFARAKLCIEDEYTIKGAEVTTRRIAEETRAAEARRGGYEKTRRVADNNNLILVQDLATEFKLNFAPTDKDELHAMINKVRLWFQGNRIEIHPRCVKLIACLKAGVWNKLRTEFGVSPVHGHYDLIAALVYMVRNVPEWENPVPAYFNANMSEVIFSSRQKQSGAAEELKRAFSGQ